jgi:HlyD family secretion protein
MSAPAPAIPPLAPQPEVVPARPRRPGNGGIWLGSILALVMIAGALYWQRRSASNRPATPAAGAIRTATVKTGMVEATLRLSGSTAAENFVSLITPQLRFSRSDRQRDTSAAAPAAASTTNSTASTSTSASSAGGASSTAPGASSAFQSATNRFGGTLRGSAPASSSPASGTSAPASSAMGAGGLGSAADSGGISGGGAGNGPGDSTLILQDVAKAGVHVHKGDSVSEFDRQYMLQRLDDYKASVAQSEAALKKQKAELEITRKAHDQLIEKAKGVLEKARLDLKTVPVLSAIDAERARLALEEAEAHYQQLLKEVKYVQISQDADIRNAELDLMQVKIELRRAEVNVDKMIGKAPIDGLVVMQNTFRGAEFGQIQKGDQLWPGQFYMQIVNPSSMVVNANVNQVDVDKLRLGQKARVRFDAYPDLELPAHIVTIGAMTRPGGFRATFVKEVPLRLQLDKMDARVIPDLSVAAEIILDSEPQAATLAPAGSVFEDERGRTIAFVERPGGWERRDVRLGLHSHTAAAVREGLRPGEVVALDRPPSEPGK